MRIKSFISGAVYATLVIILFNACDKCPFEVSRPVRLPAEIVMSVSTNDEATVFYTKADVAGSVVFTGNPDLLPNTLNNNLSVVVKYGTDQNNLDRQTGCILQVPETGLWATTVQFQAELDNLDDGAVYYYMATATYGSEAPMDARANSFFTLPEGPVDLDLASGNLWASANIGANYPEETGDFYAWGDTLDPMKKSHFDWSSYKWSNGSNYSLTKYNLTANSGDNGFVDGKDELEDEDDVVKIKLGGKWQTPTVADFNELIKTCAYIETKINGVSGYLFSSKTDQDNPKKKMFMPYTGYQNGKDLINGGFIGYYWTRNLYNGYSWTSENACNFFFRSFGIEISNSFRCNGEAIRPVLKK